MPMLLDALAQVLLPGSQRRHISKAEFKYSLQSNHTSYLDSKHLFPSIPPFSPRTRAAMDVGVDPKDRLKQDQRPRMEKGCSTVINRITGVRGNGIKT
ncbi:hypothetical protein E5288_WYG017816 [Bos mutus]|uniref:Uncharacterized protein n=1 Tax=Bos mutus TaxID=72004 RepID=A0A6B0SBA2_9CETA|nr:hypothetical protein [Bos mutus]